LIYREKKTTWDELLKAVKSDWKGYENLRQLCVNSVPKYGNDNDYADEWAAFVMDTWADSIDLDQYTKRSSTGLGRPLISASMTTGSNTVA